METPRIDCKQHQSVRFVCVVDNYIAAWREFAVYRRISIFVL